MNCLVFIYLVCRCRTHETGRDVLEVPGGLTERRAGQRRWSPAHEESETQFYERLGSEALFTANRINNRLCKL